MPDVQTDERVSNLALGSVISQGRIREELGNIDELINSIRQYGLIQPIVIERSSLALVAGGRRLTALQRMGIKELVHARDFIWRDEQDEKRLKAIELEENIRRKALTWQEEVKAKQQLLADLQEIHGVSGQNRPVYGEPEGFSIRKLAAVLGESVSQVSKDITVAKAITAMPSLGNSDSKGAVYTRLRILGNVAQLATAAKVIQTQNAIESNKKEQKWVLYEGDFRDHVSKIEDESVDFIHTDLPYGASVEKMSSHASSPGFNDSRTNAVSLLGDVARESYRVLRVDRYAAFWFGFNFYAELIHELKSVGFTVPPVPVVWIKNTKSGENPTNRYSNSYEACLIAVKGSPVLMRPGASNVKTFPTVTEKLHVAEKPTELIIDIMKDLVGPNAVVVDFMSGSGSTGVAALKHNCSKVILFEKESHFCDIIRSKLAVL